MIDNTDDSLDKEEYITYNTNLEKFDDDFSDIMNVELDFNELHNEDDNDIEESYDEYDSDNFGKQKIFNGDKIFFNKWDNGADVFSNAPVNFSIVDESSENIEEKRHENILFEKIDFLIKSNEKYNDWNSIVNNRLKKLDKIEINDVWTFIVKNLYSDEYSRIDIFSVLHQYFDIPYSRFYESLSNFYKNELLDDLNKKTGILDKKKLNHTF
jgi:hypothetical protein